MLHVYLGGVSGNIKYSYDINKGLLLVLLHVDQLVDPCFDSINVLDCGCAS